MDLTKETKLETAKDICDAIGRTVSRRKFFEIKKELREFAEETGNDKLQRLLNVFNYEKFIAEIDNSNSVYRDLPELDRTIICEFRKVTGIKDEQVEVLPRLRATIVLHWHGFEREEIADLKQEEISFEDKTVCGVRISDYGFNVIEEYLRCPYMDYYDIKSRLAYLPSDYFVRTTREMVDRNTVLTYDFRQFKSYTNDSLQLKTHNIKINGILEDIWNAEKNNKTLSEIQVVKKILREKNIKETYYIQVLPLYEKWKEMYLS